MRHIKWQWVAKGVAFALVFFFVFTGVTMFLWNHLAVEIFGLPALNFTQTLGLMILGRLLTGGFGPRRWGGGFGSRMRGKYMSERWQRMSPEEREKFMQRWGRHRFQEQKEADEPDPGIPS
ncbi:MAG: hypothetical protein KDC65_01775 [Saprospiraceae bacterium]|nr:hypothetical protein [Saprospiraceae bacterium]